MKISLIVPVFNEEQTIALFYHAVRRELKLGDTEVEIVSPHFIDPEGERLRG